MRRPSRIQSKRISNTPSRSGPMNVFGRTITDLEPAPARVTRDPLGLDLRLAVVADPDERRVLADRVVLGHAVDRRRGDQHRAAHACLERGRQHDAVPSTFTERIASREAWIGSAAAAWTSTSAPSTSRASATGSRTSPRSSST